MENKGICSRWQGRFSRPLERRLTGSTRNPQKVKEKLVDVQRFSLFQEIQKGFWKRNSIENESRKIHMLPYEGWVQMQVWERWTSAKAKSSKNYGLLRKLFPSLWVSIQLMSARDSQNLFRGKKQPVKKAQTPAEPTHTTLPHQQVSNGEGECPLCVQQLLTSPCNVSIHS